MSQTTTMSADETPLSRTCSWTSRLRSTPGSAPTLDALRTHVKAGHPAFMAPKRLVLVDEIPRTALGKPIRH